MTEVVKGVINAFDPIGVLPYAPDDEYEVEIALIVEFIEENRNVNKVDLGKFIYNVFIKALTESAFLNTGEDCVNVAKLILAQL